MASSVEEYENQELRAVILSIIAFLKEWLRKWWLHLIMMLIFGGIAYFFTSKKVDQYQAKASFMAADNEGNGIGGLLRVAGQFGLGGGASQVDSDLMLELLSAKKIVYTALLSSVNIEGKVDLLANHFLSFEPSLRTVGDKEYQDFQFKGATIDVDDRVANSIISQIYDEIAHSYLSAFASKEGIVHIEVTSKYEGLSLELSRQLMYALSEYYKTSSVEKQQSNVDVLEERVDSINGVMKNAQYALTAWYEKQQNRLKAGTVSPSKYMEKVELERRAEVANVVYLEVIKSKEIAEMTLETQRPIVQLIDVPSYPLRRVSSGWIVPVIVACFLALILSTILIILNKLIGDALRTKERI